MKALPKSEIEKALKDLPGWILKEDALYKSFRFSDFKNAFAFMASVAKSADAMDHHPEWSNVYNKVDVRLTTHDLGNKVGSRDLALAKAMNDAEAALVKNL